MAKSVTNRLGQTRWSSGTDTVRRLDFDTDAANLESLVVVYKQGLLSARPAAGVQGRFYTVTGEADAKLNGRVYYDNGSVWLPSKYMADATIESTNVNNTSLTVKGLSGQSADILSVQSFGGNSLFRVTNTGVASNQDSVGVSGGVYLGKTSSHDAALAANSVAADKPVLVIKGTESQSAPLIAARNSLSVGVFTVNNNGDAAFNGVVSAQRFVSAGGTVDTISSTTAANLVALTVSPVNSNGVAAKFKGAQAPQNNLVDFLDSSDTRVARILSDGTIVTNARSIVGFTANESSQSYSSNFPQLYVQNNQPGAAVARLVAHSQQTANLLEVVNSGGAQVVAAITNTGDARFTGTVKGNAAVIGNTTQVSPGAILATGRQPALEVITGTAQDAFNDTVVFRHPGTNSTAARRELNLLLGLSTEANATEAAKSVGIGARSTSASSADPSLILIAGGSESGSLTPAGLLTVTGSLAGNAIRTGDVTTNKTHWTLSPDVSTSIGNQNGSLFMRAPKFYWYTNGSYNATTGNAGGGSNAMSLDGGADNRLTVGRLTLTDFTAYDFTTPALQIGPQSGGRMQFSNATISAWNGTSSSSLNLQINGGILNLGSAESAVKLPSRTLYIGGNRVYFGGSSWDAVGGGATGNDWWFDHTNNQIKVYNGTAWKIVADDATFG